MKKCLSVNWKPIGLDDLEELRQLLRVKNPEMSELSLANLFLWQDFDRTYLARLGPYLLIRLNPPNELPYLLEPLGPPPPSLFLEACLQEFGRFSRISEIFLGCFPEKGIVIKENRDQADYLYWREELVLLQGKKFDGKRNLLRRFKISCPEYYFKIMDRRSKDQALDFFYSWASQKGEVNLYPISFEDQARAITRAFEFWEELDLLGGFLVSKKEIKGFVIASRLNKETATVHFQYADLASPGAFQTLFWEACRQLLTTFSLINLEQDLGVPGLRKAKLSYHPCRLIAKYEVEIA